MLQACPAGKNPFTCIRIGKYFRAVVQLAAHNNWLVKTQPFERRFNLSLLLRTGNSFTHFQGYWLCEINLLSYTYLGEDQSFLKLSLTFPFTLQNFLSPPHRITHPTLQTKSLVLPHFPRCGGSIYHPSLLELLDKLCSRLDRYYAGIYLDQVGNAQGQ